MDYTAVGTGAVIESLDTENSKLESYLNIGWLFLLFTKSQFCTSFWLFQKFIFIYHKLHQVFVIAKTIITKLQNLPKWRDEASACTESMGSVRYGPEFEDLHHSNTQETTSSLHADNLFLEQNLEIFGSSSLNSNYCNSYPTCHSPKDSTSSNQVLHLAIHLKATQLIDLNDAKSRQNRSLMPLEKYVPLIEIHIKENDNFQKNPCTPSELNQEKRLRILEGLINTPFCCRKRCVAALLQKNRINRCQFQNFSISKSPYLRADDDASSHNLSGIRQLFVRKKWGPVMDLNALILTKDQPRSNRKQWGPIADLNTILYTCSTVPKCNRKRWGPISDLSGMANVTRQLS